MRGGEGGDGAAAGTGSSAWPRAGAAVQAYTLGRGATEPDSTRGGRWDAARRIQSASAARARLPAPWPSSIASPVSQQMHLRASRLDASPGGSSLAPSLPAPPPSAKQGVHHLGQL